LPSATGELGQEVLVHAPEDVLGAVLTVAQPDIADQVDQLAEALLVQPRLGIVLGQHALQGGVVPLDGQHGVINDLSDGRLLGTVLQQRPARLPGHPETVHGAVLVGILGIGALGAFGLETGVLLLESVGDVLQEDQPQDDVFVLGRVHVRAQRVGGAPQLGLESQVGTVVRLSHRTSPFYGGGAVPARGSPRTGQGRRAERLIREPILT